MDSSDSSLLCDLSTAFGHDSWNDPLADEDMNCLLEFLGPDWSSEAGIGSDSDCLLAENFVAKESGASPTASSHVPVQQPSFQFIPAVKCRNGPPTSACRLVTTSMKEVDRVALPASSESENDSNIPALVDSKKIKLGFKRKATSPPSQTPTPPTKAVSTTPAAPNTASIDWRLIEDPAERRRQRRLAKNRMTAAKSRERRKCQFADLEARLSLLEEENKRMKFEMERLEKENTMLKSQGGKGLVNRLSFEGNQGMVGSSAMQLASAGARSPL